MSGDHETEENELLCQSCSFPEELCWNGGDAHTAFTANPFPYDPNDPNKPVVLDTFIFDDDNKGAKLSDGDDFDAVFVTATKETTQSGLPETEPEPEPELSDSNEPSMLELQDNSNDMLWLQI